MTRTPTALCVVALAISVGCGGNDLICPSGSVLVDGRCIVPDAGPDAADAGDCGDEVCNGADDDCDGEVDEADPTIGAACGADVGACETGTMACASGELTCDGAVMPTDETCNEIDDDCDGTIDEGVTVEHYADTDEDGFGDPETMMASCGDVPEGRVDNGDDCDDDDERVFPGTAFFYPEE